MFPSSPSSRSISSIATCRPTCESIGKRTVSSSSTPAESTHRASQRERPPRHGANKFTTRVLTKGTYYVWVDACQPDYQLRTKLFDVPPYLKPEQAEQADPAAIAAAARRAIRTAMDFQLLAGDSWHANTPRKGHPLDRVANFSPRNLDVRRLPPHPFHHPVGPGGRQGGYDDRATFCPPVPDRAAGQQPRAVPRSSRGALGADDPRAGERAGPALDDRHGLREPRHRQPRNNLHRGIAEFLKLYYDGRTELPADESNGNNPVSRYKVATDSWRQLDELYRRTGEPRDAATRDLVASFCRPASPRTPATWPHRRSASA